MLRMIINSELKISYRIERALVFFFFFFVFFHSGFALIYTCRRKVIAYENMFEVTNKALNGHFAYGRPFIQWIYSDTVAIES